ncbi:CGNR zinc finger domain-containing protein [Kitasatospora sp. NA04385]|uniref:CGNR zinc finger domain-containing protein n=1 Tax=Kitasatospora sp. NA04385 TaxID=2742135 RepID=UPI001590D3AF|nr:CGNR zinc finger domain-containing protein [Kitasatospora sp. NA04385]QKW18495.1 CGNR zinc finger domain-containing protein [Kitasatospora sp. NA04385]
MANGDGTQHHWPALDLVGTIRHDGNGGVLDDLAEPGAAAAWLAEHGERFTGTAELPAPDAELHAEVVALRRAARALFARAVSPGPASRADAHRLMPADEALARLNAAAALDPVAPQLDWSADDGPTPARPLSSAADPRARLLAALARAVVEFLTGPDRERLRACQAPRCVRYFIKTHGRQEWCKTSCGNRARVARHYDRQRTGADA